MVDLVFDSAEAGGSDMPFGTDFDLVDGDPPVLRRGRTFRSSRTGNEYRVGEELGAGGFGAVYRCHFEGDSDTMYALKVTTDQSSWVREVYFGELLSGVKRAIQVHDAFPVRLSGRAGPMGYFTVMDLATGDLCDHLERLTKAPTESTIVSNFRGLLAALTHLHARGAIHRDLTPFNIFVDDHGHFLLGDFGLAKHPGAKKGVAANAFNRYYKPPEIEWKTNTWSVEQDIWQVGQLLAVAIQKDPYAVIDAGQVRHLDCSPWLKEIVFHAVGPSAIRFRSATDMREALLSKSTAIDSIPRARKPGSLNGRRIVFTGTMPGLSRDEAWWRAEKKKAIVGYAVTSATDYLVVGDTVPLYAAGKIGKKIITAAELNGRGARIRSLTAGQFKQLI
jgi:serine/threonine protein kinase